jgi:CYTH domain-containing protein
MDSEMANFFAAKSGKKVESKPINTEADMAVKEIEHRYLLSAVPEGMDERAYSTVHVEQAYLMGDTIKERFSRRQYIKGNETNPTGTVMFTRTVKIGHGLERYEFQESISEAFFQAMYDSLYVKHLSKTRHRARFNLSGGIRTDAKADFLIVEVDEFTDRELFLAEMEVPSIESKIITPEWLTPCVIREITTEKEFEGASLAK